MLVKGLIVLASALLGSASAATSSSSTAASKTSSTASATHTVAVGADGFNFSPSQLNASVGDIIEYRFYPQNHSVARAAYGQPCIPYEYTAAGRIGFWSGFFPVQLVLTDPPKFQVRVNDTDPIFFYCSAPGACLQGMVGVINPNSTETFDNQFAFSQNATEDFSPGENPFPVESAPVRTTTATGATMTPTPSSSTSSATAAATTSAAAAASSHKSGLGTGPIVGIVIGAVAFAVLAGAVVYMCGRQKTIKEVLRHSHAPPPGTNSYQPASPGFSEANYPNMQKTGISSLMSGRFSTQTPYGPGPGTETESYRSASPPVDERTGMMHAQHGIMNPGSFGAGFPPGSPGSTQISGPSPMYYDAPEADGTLRSYPPPTSHPNPEAHPAGPHELAVPSRNPSNAATTSLDANSPRPFSFTDSESGYAQQRDEKTLNSLASSR